MDEEWVNEVRLVGRVSGTPETTALPSGDELVKVRLVVPRTATSSSRGRPGVDVLDCAAWGAGLRRRVAAWGDGDVVEVTGAVRRRFFRAGGATASRVEIELVRGRVSRRAASA